MIHAKVTLFASSRFPTGKWTGKDISNYRFLLDSDRLSAEDKDYFRNVLRDMA